jgi:hypothetical protein
VTGEELPNWKEYKDDWDRITQDGMIAQQHALANPEYADDMTAELMGFLDEERARRMVA